MNLYEIGFFHNDHHTTALLVLAESGMLAREHWPVSEDKNRISVVNHGEIKNQHGNLPGIYALMGYWEGYTQPDLEFDSYARNSWMLVDGTVKDFHARGRKSIPKEIQYNVPLTLDAVFETIGMPLYLQSKDSSVLARLNAEIRCVYFGYHQHPAENEPTRWLTITVNGAGKDVCIGQSRGDLRPEPEIYHTLLASALTSVITSIMRDNPIHEPRPEKAINPDSLDRVTALLASYAPSKAMTPGDFPTDGRNIPTELIMQWMEQGDPNHHGVRGKTLHRLFEHVQFLTFPDGKSMAVVGRLRDEKITLGECSPVSEGLDMFQKLLTLLLRRHAYMRGADDGYRPAP